MSELMCPVCNGPMTLTYSDTSDSLWICRVCKHVETLSTEVSLKRTPVLSRGLSRVVVVGSSPKIRIIWLDGRGEQQYDRVPTAEDDARDPNWVLTVKQAAINRRFPN